MIEWWDRHYVNLIGAIVKVAADAETPTWCTYAEGISEKLQQGLEQLCSNIKLSCHVEINGNGKWQRGFTENHR